MKQARQLSTCGFAVFGMLAAVVFLSTAVRAAGDPSAELKTAATHAGFSAKYDTAKEVGQHLHHAINCLVGPQDKMFDQSAGNPCQGQGNGFLPDYKASKGEDTKYHEANLAARIGSEALSSNNLAEQKAGARILSMVLQEAQKEQ
jgi:hypothetical protein